MKKLFKELRQLCPGRLFITIDDHLLFGETAEQVINRNIPEYGIHADKMVKLNTIIRVEAAPISKPMPPAVCYHWDIELALKDVLNQIKLWEPKN